MPKTKKYEPIIVERLMVFVDGGYLRELARKFLGEKEIDWKKLRNFFIEKFNEFSEPFSANLIRIYYYDGHVIAKDPDYERLNRRFNQIRNCRQYTLRLREAIRGGEGRLKQKGVDVSMALDVLSKAFQNQFDAAIFLAGDRDFLPLIEALKDTGKKVLGFYFKGNCAYPVRIAYDVRYPLGKEDFESFCQTEK